MKRFQEKKHTSCIDIHSFVQVFISLHTQQRTSACSDRHMPLQFHSHPLAPSHQRWAKAGLFPSGRWAESQGGSHSHQSKTSQDLGPHYPSKASRTDTERVAKSNQESKSSGNTRGDEAIPRSRWEVGVRSTRQVHSDKAETRSSQEVSLQVEVWI